MLNELQLKFSLRQKGNALHAIAPVNRGVAKSKLELEVYKRCELGGAKG